MGFFIEGTTPVRQFYQGDMNFGPTFESEIQERGGLWGQHWTWMTPGLFGSAVTIEFFEDTPQAVIDGVLAVYEAHNPAKPAHTEQP